RPAHQLRPRARRAPQRHGPRGNDRDDPRGQLLHRGERSRGASRIPWPVRRPVPRDDGAAARGWPIEGDPRAAHVAVHRLAQRDHAVHFDRYSNVLMQIRGSKQVAVFPNFRPDIVPVDVCEAYMDRQAIEPLWRDELDQHAIKFQFRPGDALHIPYTSGHYVKNGAEDVSISLSFFFQTDETLRWTRAMRFNHRWRRWSTAVGLRPTPVGHSHWLDAAKSHALPCAEAMGRVARRLRS